MCCYVLGVVGSSLKMANNQHPTRHNMSQQGGQTHAAYCAQQCCDMLRWHVVIVSLGLKNFYFVFHKIQSNNVQKKKQPEEKRQAEKQAQKKIKDHLCMAFMCSVEFFRAAANVNCAHAYIS